MSYWWVSQRKTWKHERRGNYLWAPLRDEAGNTPHHWQNMANLAPGDVLFSYVNQRIVAVSVVNRAAEPSERPDEFGREDGWEIDGLLVPVTYHDLMPSLPIAPLRNRLRALLPDRSSPLTVNGGGVQGYLFSLPTAAADFLIRAINDEAVGEVTFDEMVANAVAASPILAGERDAVIRARIGQGRFRTQLLDHWQGRCCVTGLNVPELLRASHIKPWRDANNEERVSVFNGLLLAPHLDALFDRGLITFENNGKIKISTRLTADQCSMVGINEQMRVAGIVPEHLPYLEYHQQRFA